VFPVRYGLDSYILFGVFSEGSFRSRVEAGSNTSSVPLRIVRGDEKGIQCLGVSLGHPVPGVYKYGELALQVGEVSSDVPRDSDP
jgi:hypothetical protein